MREIFVLSEKVFAGAKNLPVIRFDYYDKEVTLSGYDAILFSSKNGVLALDAINGCWKAKEIYSIGSGTSQAIRELGGEIAYEAKSSYGDRFAEEILPLLEGKKALFVRPKVVTSHLGEILRQGGIDLDEEILYETKCNDCSRLTPPPEGAVIIFSSPSTIDCFFRCFSWQSSYRAVVIGEKTASRMPKEIDFQISQRQTIPACIETAQTLLKSEPKR